MHKKAGLVFISIGAVLILSALLLLMMNRTEDDQAGKAAQDILQDVRALIDERTADADKNEPDRETNDSETSETGEPAETLPDTAEETEYEMPVIMLDGQGYIGVLIMPTLELELPVMSDWDYEKLKSAPCRQFGSVDGDDLVIAAHNYKQHFGKLRLLKTGDGVQFLDMDGVLHEYEVTRIGTVAATAVDEVQNSDHDLILYTCTYSGEDRIAAFLDRTED